LTNAASVADLNNFDYVPTADHPQMPDDSRGLRCPIGSHARRANPRSSDVLGHMGQTIRLIRRGMPYGPPHVRGDGKERGMLGLFLCASLKQQFEFILRNWINDGLFARGLDPAEKDPMMSRFVKTRGAAYLFFPSVSALRLIATRSVEPLEVVGPVTIEPEVPAPSKTAPPPPTPDPTTDPIGFIVNNTLKRVGSSTSRDAHPKHHGLVKARFEVLGPDSLSGDAVSRRPLLAHGIFGRPQAYTAYIRFSNGSPLRVTPDGAPDLRGMAIKLFNVPGKKLADEQGTQDFILASDPRFFVKNLHEYPIFLRTAPADLPRHFPILFQASRSHDNPLTIQYWSQTPYACGPALAVKYTVLPLDPARRDPIELSEEDIALRGPNYLREAMAATLAAQDVTMDFMAQLVDPSQIDDATVNVTTDFTTVARITIPKQEFRSLAQMKLAEDISFNPWHGIEDHKPLGSINETRKAVYEAVAELRHKNGGVAAFEPTGREL
jgi:hypothetical protein